MQPEEVSDLAFGLSILGPLFIALFFWGEPVMRAAVLVAG